MVLRLFPLQHVRSSQMRDQTSVPCIVGGLLDYQQSPINLFSIELELIYNIMLVSSENIENFKLCSFEI